MTVADRSHEYDAARRRVPIAVAGFANLLLFATWRLWRPEVEVWTAEHSSFPQVPLLTFAGSLPNWLEYLFLVMTIVSTWVLALSRSRKAERAAIACFLLGAVGMVLFDQHRLQPWLYLFGILSLFALMLDSKRFVTYSRWLLVSVYVFSAWSKFDHTFVHTLGQQFIDVMTAPIQRFGIVLDRQSRVFIAYLFPLAELLVGLGLCWKPTRKSATAGAIALHVCLMLVLGPLGLGHHLGVLIWNLFFVVLLWMLFWTQNEKPPEPAPAPSTTARWTQRVAIGAILLPLLEPFGLLDHWPAWQVYAPRNSRVVMEIKSDSLNKLPADLTPFLREIEDVPWARLDLDAWSLVRLSAPNYPQDRFQLGVALAVARRCSLGDAVKVTLQGPANRRDGCRQEEVLRGVEDIEKAAKRFRLNAWPASK